jgi:hypothetical protein
VNEVAQVRWSRTETGPPRRRTNEQANYVEFAAPWFGPQIHDATEMPTRTVYDCAAHQILQAQPGLVVRAA